MFGTRYSRYSEIEEENLNIAFKELLSSISEDALKVWGVQRVYVWYNLPPQVPLSEIFNFFTKEEHWYKYEKIKEKLKNGGFKTT